MLDGDVGDDSDMQQTKICASPHFTVLQRRTKIIKGIPRYSQMSKIKTAVILTPTTLTITSYLHLIMYEIEGAYNQLSERDIKTDYLDANTGRQTARLRWQRDRERSILRFYSKKLVQGRPRVGQQGSGIMPRNRPKNSGLDRMEHGKKDLLKEEADPVARNICRHILQVSSFVPSNV